MAIDHITTTRDILIAAKALIPDEEHWWRGESGAPPECHCPLTALWAVSISRVSHDDRAKLRGHSREVFARAAGLDTPESTLKVAAWSDDPNRTLAEVHAAFDRAIASVSP